MNLNKYLFKNYYKIYYYLSAWRCAFWIHVGNINKAKEIITEHFNWLENEK